MMSSHSSIEEKSNESQGGLNAAPPAGQPNEAAPVDLLQQKQSQLT